MERSRIEMQIFLKKLLTKISQYQLIIHYGRLVVIIEARVETIADANHTADMTDQLQGKLVSMGRSEGTGWL